MTGNIGRPEERMRLGAIVGGTFLLVLGGTMFLERSGLADISVWRVIGPACLIIMGVVVLVGSGLDACDAEGGNPVRARARRRDRMTGGLWLLGVGCWLLVSQLHVFGLEHRTSWPLLIVLAGIIMLVRGTR